MTVPTNKINDAPEPNPGPLYPPPSVGHRAQGKSAPPPVPVETFTQKLVRLSHYIDRLAEEIGTDGLEYRTDGRNIMRLIDTIDQLNRLLGMSETKLRDEATLATLRSVVARFEWVHHRQSRSTVFDVMYMSVHIYRMAMDMERPELVGLN